MCVRVCVCVCVRDPQRFRIFRRICSSCGSVFSCEKEIIIVIIIVNVVIIYIYNLWGVSFQVSFCIIAAHS